MTVITNAAGLQNMAANLAGDYELGNDINCSGIANFEPVGGWNGLGPFTGSFDGKGYKVSNLTIGRAADHYIGLFGETDGATIQNVTLVDVAITGNEFVGALIGGYSSESTITNCSASGTLTANGFYSGGLIGYDYLGTITNCSSSVAVSSVHTDVGGFIGGTYYSTISDSHATGAVISTHHESVGGFAGRVEYGSITRCYATGNVTAGNGAFTWGAYGIGGFVGHTLNIGTITRCYATGDVVAIDGTATDARENGGFVGQLDDIAVSDCYATGAVTSAESSAAFAGQNDGSITNCYATGLVTCGTYSGGLVGTGPAPPYWNLAINSFWDKESTGEATSDSGTGKTTAQMKALNTILAAGWSIPSIWNVSPGCNSGYPCLVGVNLCCSTSAMPPADPTIAPKKVSLELIRNIEMMNIGRFYISKSGNAVYESRYHR